MLLFTTSGTVLKPKDNCTLSGTTPDEKIWALAEIMTHLPPLGVTGRNARLMFLGLIALRCSMVALSFPLGAFLRLFGPSGPPVLRKGRAPVVLGVYLIVACSLLCTLEKWELLDAVYFVTATLTTIGGGELSPTSPGGKAVECSLVLVGPILAAAFWRSSRDRCSTAARDVAATDQGLIPPRHSGTGQPMRLHTRSAAALPEDDEYHAQEQEERAARLADAVWASVGVLIPLFACIALILRTPPPSPPPPPPPRAQGSRPRGSASGGSVSSPWSQLLNAFHTALLVLSTVSHANLASRATSPLTRALLIPVMLLGTMIFTRAVWAIVDVLLPAPVPTVSATSHVHLPPVLGVATPTLHHSMVPVSPSSVASRIPGARWDAPLERRVSECASDFTASGASRRVEDAVSATPASGRAYRGLHAVVEEENWIVGTDPGSVHLLEERLKKHLDEDDDERDDDEDDDDDEGWVSEEDDAELDVQGRGVEQNKAAGVHGVVHGTGGVHKIDDVDAKMDGVCCEQDTKVQALQADRVESERTKKVQARQGVKEAESISPRPKQRLQANEVDQSRSNHFGEAKVKITGQAQAKEAEEMIAESNNRSQATAPTEKAQQKQSEDVEMERQEDRDEDEQKKAQSTEIFKSITERDNDLLEGAPRAFRSWSTGQIDDAGVFYGGGVVGLPGGGGRDSRRVRSHHPSGVHHRGAAGYVHEEYYDEEYVDYEESGDYDDDSESLRSSMPSLLEVVVEGNEDDEEEGISSDSDSGSRSAHRRQRDVIRTNYIRSRTGSGSNGAAAGTPHRTADSRSTGGSDRRAGVAMTEGAGRATAGLAAGRAASYNEFVVSRLLAEGKLGQTEAARMLAEYEQLSASMEGEGTISSQPASSPSKTVTGSTSDNLTIELGRITSTAGSKRSGVGASPLGTPHARGVNRGISRGGRPPLAVTPTGSNRRQAIGIDDSSGSAPRAAVSTTEDPPISLPPPGL